MHMVVGDGIGSGGEGGLKHVAVGRNVFEPGDQKIFGGDGHFYGVQDGATGLFFYIFGAAIPELKFVGGCIEHGGGIAATKTAIVAFGSGEIIYPKCGEIVAAVAAVVAGFAEAGVVIQMLAEEDLGIGYGIVGTIGPGGQGFKNFLGALE